MFIISVINIRNNIKKTATDSFTDILKDKFIKTARLGLTRGTIHCNILERQISELVDINMLENILAEEEEETGVPSKELLVFILEEALKTGIFEGINMEYEHDHEDRPYLSFKLDL